MRLLKGLLCVGLFVVIICGCGERRVEEVKPEEGRMAITPANMERIVGMQWILREMKVDGAGYVLSGEVPFMKIEKDGKVGGFASVNRFFGGMQIDDGGSVKWSPFGSTRMAGPAEAMKQEQAFLKAMPKTVKISFEKIYLYFTSEDGKTELVFYVPVR